jgi:hypothetical protein
MTAPATIAPGDARWRSKADSIKSATMLLIDLEGSIFRPRGFDWKNFFTCSIHHFSRKSKSRG